MKGYPNLKVLDQPHFKELPAHWSAVRLKFHLPRSNGGVWGEEPDGVGDTIVLRSTEQTVDGQWNVVDPASRKLSLAEREGALLQLDDLLMTKASGSSLHIGKTTIVGADVAGLHCCFSNFTQRLRTAASLRPRLAWYLLNSRIARDQFDLLSNSTTGLANLTPGVIGDLVVPVPPVTEQDAIISFLDRETGKIDTLVQEQRRLIELLKEKRQAVISHAVTKGLDPNAKMKPSSVEWLGDVPEHWGVLAVRHLLTRIEQGWSPECENRQADIDEWGVLKAGCANGAVFRASENKALPDTLSPLPDLEVRVGDVIMSRANGSPENVGAVAYVGWVRPKLMLSDKTFRLHPSARMRPKFLALLLSSRPLRHQIERSISGADGLANNLPQSALRAFVGVAPPLEDQDAIVERVELTTGRLGILVSKAEEAITLLLERRSALISAAITGKIDVREGTIEQEDAA